MMMPEQGGLSSVAPMHAKMITDACADIHLHSIAAGGNYAAASYNFGVLCHAAGRLQDAMDAYANCGSDRR